MNPRPDPTRQLLATAALLGALIAGVAAAPATAAPDGALASATYGKAEIWLQRQPADHKQREFVFQPSPNAPARVLALTVPSYIPAATDDLALGLDARGRLTLVTESTRGLYATPVDGTPRLHRIRGTTKNDASPSVFRGKLAYGRSIGESRSAVRLGSLATGVARTIWSNASDDQWFVAQTAVGRSRSVAFVTARDGAANGAYRAYVAPPGRRAKRVLHVNLGHFGEGGIAIAGLRSDGRRVTINRTLDDDSADHVYALPSGREIR